jgi:hypothetical protein
LARVKEEAAHFWHQAANAHEAYDKMKPHVGKDASIIMKGPNSGLVHKPDQIGPEHFTHFGEPKKTIYLMHPDEVDDWIAKHGKKGDDLDMPLSQVRAHPRMGAALRRSKGHGLLPLRRARHPD